MAAFIDRAVRAVTSSRDVTYTILALNYSVQVQRKGKTEPIHTAHRC